jgi:hypothetical protein
MYPDSYFKRDEPAAEKKLFAGTLQGYRHFRVKRYGGIASPAYGHFHWRDGENVSSCSHLDGNGGSFETWGHTLENQISSTEERIRELEREAQEEQHARWAVRSSRSAWDITPFAGTGDGNFYYQVADDTAHRLANLREELRCYKIIVDERAKFVRGEHRLKGCTCGFYVSYDPTVDFYATTHHQHVHAVVECYGSVVLGTKGFRAQKLKVVAMAPFDRPALSDMVEFVFDSLTGNYRAAKAERVPVPVIADYVAQKFPSARWFDKWEDMVKAYPEPARDGLTPDKESDYGA